MTSPLLLQVTQQLRLVEVLLNDGKVQAANRQLRAAIILFQQIAATNDAINHLDGLNQISQRIAQLTHQLLVTITREITADAATACQPAP